MNEIWIVLLFIAAAAVIVYLFPTFFGDDNNIFKNYRKLKSEQIDKIPDEELEAAVTEWLFAKIDNKGTTEFSIVNALARPCKYFYSIYIVTEEICNGSIAQCCINSTRFFMKFAENGFKDIGAENLAEILSKANAIFDEFLKEHDEKISSLAEICGISELDNLTDEFKNSADLENLSTLVIDYIRKNAEYFGD